MSEIHEFYGPFAHIPGRYEWARILSTTHGAFDAFIIIHQGTERPVTVYVDSEEGERFMADRYPESRAIRAADGKLTIRSEEAGRRLVGELSVAEGPVRRASMQFVAREDALPRAVPYGDSATPVWGSSYACQGVDLELPALVTGEIVVAEESSDGPQPAGGAGMGVPAGALVAGNPIANETFTNAQGVLTLGSYGKIVEL